MEWLWILLLAVQVLSLVVLMVWMMLVWMVRFNGLLVDPWWNDALWLALWLELEEGELCSELMVMEMALGLLYLLQVLMVILTVPGLNYQVLH